MKSVNVIWLTIIFCFCLIACTPLTPTSPSENPKSELVSPASPGIGAGSSEGPIRFISPTDGETAATQLDIEGVPSVAISVQVDLANVSDVFLSVNGVYSSSYPNTTGADSFIADFEWQVLQGDGTYTLEVSAVGVEKDEVGSASIQIQVAGIGGDFSAQATVQATARDEAAYARLVELYQSEFGLTLTAPPIGRKAGVATDPWTSNVYLGARDYQINLYPDGTYLTWNYPLGHIDYAIDKEGAVMVAVCKPVGEYSMLVVFVDYGNLGVSAEDAILALQQATDLTNASFGQYTTNTGAPILQLRTEGVFIDLPADMPENHLLTVDMIQTLTGFDASNYDWLAQVDLDSAMTFRLGYGTLENTTYGAAWGGCGKVNEIVDIWVNIDEAGQMYGDPSRLSDLLLTHEVYHLLGYPGDHTWVCNDGSMPDLFQACGTHTIPALEMGWTDTDGDGTPEILDTVSPYGLTSP